MVKVMVVQSTQRRPPHGWILALGGTSILLVLATLPVFVGADLRSMLMVAFSGVCHQIAERSPHFGGVQLAVCHRCYGIYLALPIAALIFPVLRRLDPEINKVAPILLCTAVAVPGADWLADVLGFWSNTPGSRLLTGAFFGMIAGYFLSRALTELFRPSSVPRAEAPLSRSSGR